MLIFGKRNPNGYRNIDSLWAGQIYTWVYVGKPVTEAMRLASSRVMQMAALVNVAAFNPGILNRADRTITNLSLIGWHDRDGKLVMLNDCPTLLREAMVTNLGDLLIKTNLDIYDEATEAARKARNDRREYIETALHNTVPRLDRS